MAGKNILAMALAWSKLDAQLKALRTAESEARGELVAACFPDGVAHGVNLAELGKGYTLKAFVRPNPKIDAALLKSALEQLEKLGPVGKLLAGRLVKWKPELSLSEYKKLEAPHAELFAQAIVIDKATPALELVEPK